MSKIYLEYIPKKAGDRVISFNTMLQQAPVVCPLLGLTPAATTNFQDLLQSTIDAINNVDIKRVELDNAISVKEQLEENQIKEIRKIVARMKKSELFNDAIGAQLGIMGSSIAIDNTEVKPVLKLKIVAGQVRISFKKQGMPAICIYSRQRASSANWEKIAQVNYAPFLDSRSLAQAGKPEAREYMALFHDGRTQVGQESEIYSILTGTQASELL
jgi:hypothetical protein